MWQNCLHMYIYIHYTITCRHMITLVLVGAYFLSNSPAQPTENSSPLKHDPHTTIKHSHQI